MGIFFYLQCVGEISALVSAFLDKKQGPTFL